MPGIATAQPIVQVDLVPKRELPGWDTEYLLKRMASPEHRHDAGPPNVWNSAGYTDDLFVVIDRTSRRPIGVVYRAGLPAKTDVAWWLDTRFRGKGYGKAMVDALVTQLIAEGVTGLGAIRIDTWRGEYDRASRRLVARLQARLQHGAGCEGRGER